MSDRIINFTKASITNLPLPAKGKRTYFNDQQLKGLTVDVRPSGSKSFYVYKKIKGKPERIFLGTFPDMTVEKARKQAKIKLGQIADGINPQEERRKIRAEMTFEELFDQYMNRYSKVHKKTWQHDKRDVDKYLSDWFKRKIGSIEKQEIKKRHEQIYKNNGLYQANRILTRLRAIYNKGIEWGWDGVNPTNDIKKYGETSRDRFIQPVEMPYLLRSLNEEAETIQDYFSMLLLTGARKTNTQQMKFEQVSWEYNEWRIPETKNGEPLAIALVPRAMEILERRRKKSNSQWVFPSKANLEKHFADAINKLCNENYEEKKFSDAYQFFFNIGYSTYSQVDHPTQYQRASSIYRGLKCARIEILKTKSKQNNDSANTKKIADLIKEEQKLINIDDTFDSFIWSWNQAELICHGNPTYMAKFVSLGSFTDTIVDEKRKPKYIVLFQAFVNDGKEDVDVSMEFRAAPFRNTATPFFDKIEFTQAKYHIYHFKGYHVRYFADTFLIPADNRRYELILPPDSSSLYSIVPSKKCDPLVQMSIDNMALDSTIETSTFKEYISKINKAVYNRNISSIISSAGMPTYDGLDIYSLWFMGIVPLNERFQCIISYDGRLENQYVAKLKILQTADSLTAQKEFDFYFNRLSQFLALKKGKAKPLDNRFSFTKKYSYFVSPEYPENINYLCIDHVTFSMDVHRFDMLKGESFDSLNTYKNKYYNIYMIIRKPQDMYGFRLFPTKFSFTKYNVNRE